MACRLPRVVVELSGVTSTPRVLPLRPRVAVVGGGIGGLATGAFLQAEGIAVDIYEGMDKDNYNTIMGEGGFGLWSNALRCLDKIGILRDLESYGRYMGQAGYKTKSGRWLAYPSNPLAQEVSSEPSALFLPVRNLLSVLRQSSPPLHFSSPISKITQTQPNSSPYLSRPLSLHTPRNGGTKIPISYDLVVISSGLRVIESRDSRDSVENRAESRDSREYRGYRVYRGVGGRVGGGEESFQSWGGGKRFAAVPMRDEWVWFATIPTDEMHWGYITSNEHEVASTSTEF
ncbi:hypothetical protein AAMO2058_001502400 [Amorphochlora amoebiformis]